MANGNFGHCRGCGQAILWIRTKNGKNMPVNLEMLTYRITKGGSRKIVTPNGEVYSAEIVKSGSPDATGVGYESHFATCPKANNYRKK